MSRIQPTVLLGLFALVTLILAGAAVGRVMELTAGEGTYLTALLLATLGWLYGRWNFRRAERR